jgi:GT2 family glycosyltransferase
LRRSALLQASVAAQTVYVPTSLYSVPSWDPVAITGDERNLMLSAAGAPYRWGPTGRTGTEGPPVISVVIPTRCSVGKVWEQSRAFIDQALTSIVATHPDTDLEFVLVVDADADHDTLLPWRERLGDRLVVLESTGPFNFAAKVNSGVAAASGEVVAILNDDIEIITRGALVELAAVALESDVGAVGALLRYGDGTVQHAGLVYAEGGVHHWGLGQGPEWESEHSALLVDRDVSGVTAACLVQRRSEWEAVGGLDPLLPVSFNDVDYCWRLRQRGRRIVQCNSVELFHFESQTRAPGAEDWEVIRLRSRLGGELDVDVFTPSDAIELPSRLRNRAIHRWYRLRRRLMQ